jgi:hypothetical protein
MIEKDKEGRYWRLIRLADGSNVVRNSMPKPDTITGADDVVHLGGWAAKGGWPPHNVHVQNCLDGELYGIPTGVHPKKLGCMWVRALFGDEYVEHGLDFDEAYEREAWK